MLDELHLAKRFERRRESSYNRSGANRDRVVVPPGEAHAVPVLRGPGIIRHIWLTVLPATPTCYRDVRLVIRFDEVEAPQVDVPLADFFLFGHGLLVDVNCLPIQVSQQHHDAPPYRGALNCTFPMPFSRTAEVRLVNGSDQPHIVYYYVDWEQHEVLSAPVLRFHATLHEETTEPPAGQPLVPHGKTEDDRINLDWAENYVLLEVHGYEGHYVGTGLSIACRPGDPGKWWEGDDMFIIDDEPWPPRLHGTGMEDYFNLAWGFRRVDCRPEYGVTYLDKGEDDTNQIDGRFSMYRLHLSDPIPFRRSLIATLEHGHANDCRAAFRSVAYWYGRPLG